MSLSPDVTRDPRADGALVRERLQRIRRAARLVADGNLNPMQARRVGGEIERLAGILLEQHPAPARESDTRLERLSRRERAVLAALASGESVQEVAFRFRRSPKTINNQRTSALRKLGLRNTAELTRFAIQAGLVAA